MADSATAAAHTVLEAAALLRISRSKLYELIHDQTIRSIKIGERRIIPADEIARLTTDLAAGPPTFACDIEGCGFLSLTESGLITHHRSHRSS